MKIKFSAKKLTGYLAWPLAFFVIMNLFLYCIFSPFVGITLSVWDMFSSDLRSDDMETYNDIFVRPEVYEEVDIIKASSITYPTYGSVYGEINIYTNNTVYTVPLVFGDNKPSLKRGAGHYIGSHFPGEGTTILVSGHNNNYFNCLKYTKVGEIVEVNTNYGKYIYEIVDVAAKHNSDKTAFNLEEETETLVLYTCYPFDVVGFKVQRYFVTAKLLSGPQIDPYS